ncbi:MAG: acyl-CoA dehydrogenase N-terminal domain-containing protein, partial [Rhodospirillales bacterium]|nr:acyl-CoA dehydrogenase N-terminal domain-containing protein [Rhodospirillales bacterium]
MTGFTAPLREMDFVLRQLSGLDEVLSLPGFEDVGTDTIAEVLDAAGTIAGEVLAPLNRIGDRETSRLTPEGVRTPTGWGAAWQALVEGGWNALPFSPDHGGMGMPW